MTQEEKQLLLKDFCTRLPYGVMFDYNNNEPLKVEGIVRDMVYFRGYNYRTGGSECYADITRCKPYLRPMSSMTAAEEYEYHQCKNADYLAICKMEHAEMLETAALWFSRAIDWLNKHGFDYRGLIPMGLALPATEGMYN